MRTSERLIAVGVAALVAAWAVVATPRPAFAGTVTPATVANTATAATFTLSSTKTYVARADSTIIATLKGPHDTYAATSVVAVASDTSATTSSVMATFNLGGTVPAEPGTYTLLVCQPTQFCGSNPNPASPPPGATLDTANVTVTQLEPVVTGISKAVVGRGASLAGVTVSGKNFSKHMSVSFSDPAVRFTPTQFSDTALTGTLSVDAHAALGTNTVTVANGGSSPAAVSASSPALLTVRAGPRLSELHPSGAGQGANGTGADGQPLVYRLFGNGFATSRDPAYRARLTTSSADVVPTVLKVTEDQIDFTVAVTSTASLGVRGLVVTNPDGGAAAAPLLTITAAPAPTSVTPTGLGRGATSGSIIVRGSNFTPGANAASLGEVPGITFGDSTSDAGTIAVAVRGVDPGADMGTSRAVTVVNADGGRGRCSCTLAVTNAPLLTSAQPAHVVPDGADHVVQLTGTGFDPSMSVEVRGASGVSAGSFTYVSPTSATLSLRVSAAATGLADLVLTNGADRGSSTCSACITVDNITVRSPYAPTSTVVNNSERLPVTVSGVDIPAGTTGFLVAPPSIVGQPPIPATTSTASSTGWAGTFDIRGAASGTYSIRLASPDGRYGVCGGCAISIMGERAPSLQAPATSAPALLTAGGARRVRLTGDALYRGATVSITGTGLQIGQPEWVSATSVDIPVAAAPGTTAGLRDITIRNSGSSASGTTTVTCVGCLQIVTAPAVTAVTPKHVVPGFGASVQVTGSNLRDDARYLFGTSSIEASVVSGTPTSRQLWLEVARDAPPGLLPLTVVNQDGAASVPFVGAVDVAPLPQASGAIATALLAGSRRTITVMGSGFRDGVTIRDTARDPRGAVVFGPASIDADGNLVVTATAPAGAIRGSHTIEFENPDGGLSTCVSCLRVVGTPSVPRSLRTRRQGTTVLVQWAAPLNTGGATIRHYVVTWASADRRVVGARTVGQPGTTLRRLTPGRNYRITVAAVNVYGRGSSAVVVVSVPD